MQGIRNYKYAGPVLEKALGIKFKSVPPAAIKLVKERIQKIADGLSADVHDVQLPQWGFLTKPLKPQQSKLLNEELAYLYATSNVKQHEELLQVPIKEEGEPMVNLSEHLRGLHLHFSDRPIHHACGEWARKKRVFWVREQVAQKARTVCRALNRADLMPHFEDGWRHKDVQEGLLIRRIVKIARDFPHWDFRKVKTVASSFTAPSAGLAAHMAGAAIDWRFRHLKGAQKFLELGNDYPDGTVVASLDFPYITYEQWATRVIFQETMRMAGFKTLRTENWHADHGARGLGLDGIVHMKSAFYGPVEGFNGQNGAITPMELSKETDAFFLTDDAIEGLVKDSRQRTDGHFSLTEVQLADRIRHLRLHSADERKL